MAKQDLRSEDAKRYRRLYKTPAWRRTRDHQLATHPLCQRCLAKGRYTPATVCHHVDKDSKASPETFFAGPYLSLCEPCHNSHHQSLEKGGHGRTPIGVDGWPL